MKCNHCGKEIAESKSISFKVHEDGKWIVASLCEECYQKLTYIVEQFCTKEEREYEIYGKQKQNS